MEKENKDTNKTTTNTFITQVRVPENLAQKAKVYAEDTGLSLNGLFCVALKEYLRVR